MLAAAIEAGAAGGRAIRQAVEAGQHTTQEAADRAKLAAMQAFVNTGEGDSTARFAAVQALLGDTEAGTETMKARALPITCRAPV